ncbi:glycosyltransferase family 9 protein, partial [Micromonospora sp. URMC 106]
MILALRALGVGDLATAWLTPLVDLVGSVDTLVPTDGLGPLPWTGPPPHIAVNLHGRGPQSHRMLADTRPGRLLAFTNPDAGHHDG